MSFPKFWDFRRCVSGNLNFVELQLSGMIWITWQKQVIFRRNCEDLEVDGFRNSRFLCVSRLSRNFYALLDLLRITLLQSAWFHHPIDPAPVAFSSNTTGVTADSNSPTRGLCPPPQLSLACRWPPFLRNCTSFYVFSSTGPTNRCSSLWCQKGLSWRLASWSCR